MRISWWIRFLNRIGYRKDTLMVIHKDDTWQWPAYLGKQTEGRCSKCEGPIYYEAQNHMFTMVCNRCQMKEMFLVSWQE